MTSKHKKSPQTFQISLLSAVYQNKRFGAGKVYLHLGAAEIECVADLDLPEPEEPEEEEDEDEEDEEGE